MQNRVKTPNGLVTGSKGTCVFALCDNEATRVLVHLADKIAETAEMRMGAYCAPCIEKRVRPADEVEAKHKRAMRRGDYATADVFEFGLPDSRWQNREFTAEEAAEIAGIKSGAFVETYQGQPGVFAWEPAT